MRSQRPADPVVLHNQSAAAADLDLAAAAERAVQGQAAARGHRERAVIDDGGRVKKPDTVTVTPLSMVRLPAATLPAVPISMDDVASST